MNLIVAVDQNWGIGKDGTMPWHIRTDLKYFKEKTLHKTVLMGRKTLLSFPGGRPLPERENIVLSRDTSYRVPGAAVVHDLQTLLQYRDRSDVFVIGGGSLYAALLPYCEYAYVTKIGTAFDCDTFFPNLDEMEGWEQIDPGEIQEENCLPFRFTVYQNYAVTAQAAAAATEE